MVNRKNKNEERREGDYFAILLFFYFAVLTRNPKLKTRNTQILLSERDN
jgi:hypothetical protein